MNRERTSLFLMANLGSEVTKILSAKEKKNDALLSMAFIKAEKILKDLKEMPETKNNAEIDILSDVINDLQSTESKFNISSKNLKSYFLPFVMRLMQA